MVKQVRRVWSDRTAQVVHWGCHHQDFSSLLARASIPPTRDIFQRTTCHYLTLRPRKQKKGFCTQNKINNKHTPMQKIHSAIEYITDTLQAKSRSRRQALRGLPPGALPPPSPPWRPKSATDQCCQPLSSASLRHFGSTGSWRPSGNQQRRTSQRDLTKHRERLTTTWPAELTAKSSARIGATLWEVLLRNVAGEVTHR